MNKQDDADRAASATDGEDDIEASKAPLLEHLIELRQRLVRSIIAIAIAFVVCFYFADDIFNLLIIPYERAAGEEREIRLIYTAPQEYFFTQMKLALFGALFLAFPIIANQIYKFVAPGLYKHERHAFLPYLVATPILFTMGAALVYFIVMPLALGFFLSLEQGPGEGRAVIELLPKVNEYLGLIMTLLFAFGLVFQHRGRRSDATRSDQPVGSCRADPASLRTLHSGRSAGRKTPGHRPGEGRRGRLTSLIRSYKCWI
jgi:sec-independent protein translocase protein TatC